MTRRLQKTPEDIRDELDAAIVEAAVSELSHTRNSIERYGKLTFGDRWQTPMAKALSEHLGRTISPSQVNNWLAGVRPVPKGIYDSLGTLIPKLAADLRRRADQLEFAWPGDELVMVAVRARAADAARKKKAL